MRPVTALVAAGVVCLFSATSLGFAVQTTADGDLVRWHEKDITVMLDPSLERLGVGAEVFDLIEDAFYAWMEESNIDVHFTVVRAHCVVGVPPRAAGNCVTVQETKADKGDVDAGATTFVSYSEESGAIRDADIAFYRDAGPWALPGQDGLDVYQVALHEVGHFLGLVHSAVEEAAMYPTATVGRSKVVGLHDDDRLGAAALYDTAALSDPVRCSAVRVGGGVSWWRWLWTALF